MAGHDLPVARLLWVGDGVSGPEDAIRTLPPLLELVPDAQLSIVGSAADRAAAWRLAGDLRIADRIVAEDNAALSRCRESADVILVTGRVQDGSPETGKRVASGLPEIACSPPLERPEARAGVSGSYIARAREIASVLQQRAAVASGPASRAPDGAAKVARSPDQPVTSPLDPSRRSSPASGASLFRAQEGAGSLPGMVVRLGAAWFDRSPSRSFAPLRTLDFSSLGLGDTLMAWAGLHALLHAGFRPVAAEAAMYVQGALVGVGSALFARHGVRVLPAGGRNTAKLASPTLSPRLPQSWGELYRNLAGLDWYTGCFPAVEAQKPALRSDYRYEAWERFCLGINERLLHRRRGWQAAPADYVGFRLWMPVARQMGLFPVTFLALFKQSLPHLRGEMRQIARSLDRLPDGSAIAVFPTGRSYQAFPAHFCRRLVERLHPHPIRFYLPADDPWIDRYHHSGIDGVHLDGIEDVLAVLFAAPKLITTDSFASHAAQLLRDDFVLVLTRDIRENVLHPGADPQVVSHHPRCAPCHYVPRIDRTSCPARYDQCVAFENSGLLERVVSKLSTGIAREHHER